MSKIPFHVSPMLATLVEEPFSRKGWVFEEKYDGVPSSPTRKATRLRFFPATESIERAGTARLPAKSRHWTPTHCYWMAKLLFSISIASPGSSFCSKARARLSMPFSTASSRTGRTYGASRLASRRQALEQAVNSSAGAVRPAARLAGDGIAAFERATKRGLEGVVGKDSFSRYVEGRSRPRDAWPTRFCRLPESP
jgi:hypothetical protein